MKLVKRAIEKDKSGFITLVAEDSEDMWHTYNLVHKGDDLKATTIRKVVNETATGSTSKTSVRLTITITIEEIEFDVQGCLLRINGRNKTENNYIKMGAYHTIDLELNRPFTLTKDEWDIITLDRVHDACNIATKSDIAAIVLEQGLANVCLLTQNMTIVRQRIERNVPKKGRGTTTQHDKGLENFFNDIYRSIQMHVNFEIVKVLIIASPGFVKDQFFQYMNAEAIVKENRTLIENKQKIILLHCSSGHKHALQEVLKDPAIQNRLSDTKYAIEVKTLEKFYQILGQDGNKACYGYDHVMKALDSGAIDTMMVTDGLFRSSDIATRKLYIRLVERVKNNGAQVLVFSSLHPSGEQLTNLTGIAAILHFPVDFEEE